MNTDRRLPKKTANVPANITASAPSARTKQLTEIALLPTVNASKVVASYASATHGDVDLCTLIHDLRAQCEQARAGDLQRGEAMLVAQAHSLDAIFTCMSLRAARAEYIPQLDTYLRLALKAQSQSRANWEALAAIKNPPMVFAKQANFANGHQQINNSTPEAVARVGNENRPTELLEQDHGERLDTSKTSAAIGADSVLETLGKVHRAKVASG
jgi:hypothetical protein